MTFRAKWRRDEELLSRPAQTNQPLPPPRNLTKEEFDQMMLEIHEHEARGAGGGGVGGTGVGSSPGSNGKPIEFDPFRAEEESSQAFIDSARCTRLVTDDTQCILAPHNGPCVDANGTTLLMVAAQLLGRRK